MKRFAAILLALGLVTTCSSPAIAQVERDLARYVDPLIGTYPPGFVNPGPVLPYGMVGLGPDTEGPFNYGGYLYVNNRITGFSHIHMSAGVRRGGQIPLMPVTGNVDLRTIPGPEGPPVPAYASPFSHAREVAEAGYYSVDLLRYGVTAELTATERVGMHRYTFPPGQPASVVIDAGRDIKGYNPAEVTFVDETTVTGSVTAEMGIKVFFAAIFDRPFTGRDFPAPADPLTATGARRGAILDFGAGAGTVSARVGISFVDVEGALNNIAVETAGKSFDEVRDEARSRWNDALAAIEVTGGTDAEKTSFYTALYHAQLFPNLFSDADGRYRGFDDIVRTSAFDRYTQFSLWDSYRGQNQLLSVINPGVYEDMIASLLDMYRQGGKLPRWTFANRDPAHMSGDPVVPFIGEGWCRGLLDDWSAQERDELFDAMRDLTRKRPEGRDANNDLVWSYDGLGYSPVDKPTPQFNVIEGGGGQAGTTLEYGIAESALALMAESIDRETDRDFLVERAGYYRNLLDPETKWIRPRHDDGTWLTPFVPENNYGFQEGTSWQYSWLAMQDLRGLFDLMGGNAAVQRRLDQFFNLPATGAVPVVWPKVQNQATIFGIDYHGNQYAPGNEHDLQAPFLYNYAGAPWKTQAVARGAASLYTPTPDGLPGNDDLGALSGWLVWTMLGIYPMTPGAPLYTIASPVFTHAVIHSPNGDITIDAPEASPAAKYVQNAMLNGQALDQSYFLHSDIASGELELQMGPVPRLSWAAEPHAAPPSLSSHNITAFGCPDIETGDPERVATTLTLELAGKGSRRQIIATLTESVGSRPIEGATISFTADGASLCTLATGPSGRAVCEIEPRYQGGHHTYRADFGGTDRHFPAGAEVTT